ncbi:hypothetical protein ACH47Z_05740 [Streptomyces sp. NPDC020192]|uniref:hypothetical protein n=1 Tax=Streptomyces sp. NPDC020192 TaxID=3365066 RepID=UPI00379C5F5F
MPHRSAITVQATFRASDGATERLPALITASLAELHEAVTGRLDGLSIADPRRSADSLAGSTPVPEGTAR